MNERRFVAAIRRVSVQCDGVFEGSCYTMETQGLTWADARARCVDGGGHLVIIESQAENQFVANLTQGKPAAAS